MLRIDQHDFVSVEDHEHVIIGGRPHIAPVQHVISPAIRKAEPEWPKWIALDKLFEVSFFHVVFTRPLYGRGVLSRGTR